MESDKLTMREEILLETVDKFYDDPENFRRLREFINNEPASKRVKRDPASVSLRLLDFLCTTYASTHAVLLETPGKQEHGQAFSAELKDIYRNGLHVYGKNHYDCFRRNKRLLYTKHGETIETTVGQLLYFRDALSYGILDYAHKNQSVLKKAMAEQAAEAKSNSSNTNKSKISSSATAVKVESDRAA